MVGVLRCRFRPRSLTLDSPPPSSGSGRTTAVGTRPAASAVGASRVATGRGQPRMLHHATVPFARFAGPWLRSERGDCDRRRQPRLAGLVVCTMQLDGDVSFGGLVGHPTARLSVLRRAHEPVPPRVRCRHRVRTVTRKGPAYDREVEPSRFVMGREVCTLVDVTRDELRLAIERISRRSGLLMRTRLRWRRVRRSWRRLVLDVKRATSLAPDPRPRQFCSWTAKVSAYGRVYFECEACQRTAIKPASQCEQAAWGWSCDCGRRSDVAN